MRESQLDAALGFLRRLLSDDGSARLLAWSVSMRNSDRTPATERNGLRVHEVPVDWFDDPDEAEPGRVFDRFARQDRGRDCARGGAGLGLAFVREVVNGHNGQVELTETHGGGATVTMRLPVEMTPSSSGNAPA